MAVGSREHTDEVVSSPDNLMPGHAPQFPKILRGRRFRVPEYLLVLAGPALAPPHITPDIEAVWGIDNSEVKGIVRHFPQGNFAVHVRNDIDDALSSFLVLDITNASHGETHFGWILGVYAPSRTLDDRRAIRETLASPIVDKTGASRFCGYAPLDYQSTGGL